MKQLITFLKGILVGIGGIAPGLSGSVMLLILGLYEKVIAAFGNIFKAFKKNISFLIPLVLGFGVGVFLFSKVVDYMLASFEFETRYLFLGLVVGTVPLFYKSVKKHGFSKKYYIAIGASALLGLAVFSFGGNLFSPVTNPNLLQSVLLGVAVAGSSIIPGVDSAVILSALGLYELYVSSIANLNIHVLIPAGIGLAAGALLISKIMDFFIKRFYTMTFSIIFGLFLSIIPKVLNANSKIHNLPELFTALLLTLFGFAVSFYFGNIKKCNAKLKTLFGKK